MAGEGETEERVRERIAKKKGVGRHARGMRSARLRDRETAAICAQSRKMGNAKINNGKEGEKEKERRFKARKNYASDRLGRFEERPDRKTGRDGLNGEGQGDDHA